MALLEELAGDQKMGLSGVTAGDLGGANINGTNLIFYLPFQYRELKYYERFERKSL